MKIKNLFESFAPASNAAAAHAPPHRAAGGDPLEAAHLVNLTKDLAVGFQGRTFGTEQNRRAAEWIAREMKAAGLEPANGDSFFQTFVAKVGKEELTGRNVVGLLRGTDPELSKEVIVVAGHFDSQQDSPIAANDNATGCAGVLAIAQALAKHPPKRSVLFMTFDGEEGLRTKEGYSAGRRGSRFYASSPLFPISKTALMVNMDELANVHLQSGRRDHIHQWASSDPFASRILKEAFAKTGGGKAVEGYPELPAEAQFFTTDAEPLYRLGVPTINLLSGRYLENHSPADDMSLVIPERMETYARLAHQCVADAGNHVKSLGDMGIQPGGLMPTFPLVNERRSAGLGISEEESLRLAGLHGRMVEIRRACRELVGELKKAPFERELFLVAGFERKHPVFSEPNLNDVRERKKVLLDEYRNIPKGDVARRREAQKGLELLSGVEGVLAGALYLEVLDASGGYYLQRAVDRIGELHRGAKRLGHLDKLEGIVDAEDAKKFTAAVSADRAVEMARSALPGLQGALGRAAYALMRPDDAAATERPVMPGDLADLEAAMTKAAYAALGKVYDTKKELERTTLVGALLEATLSKLKGRGDKWIEHFAEQNAMLDFAGLAKELGLAGPAGEALAQKAAELDQSLLPPDHDALKRLVPELYGMLTELAFGKAGRADTIDELAELAKHGIQAATEKAARAVVAHVDRQAIKAAEGDGEVRKLSELHRALTSTLELRQLFKPTLDNKGLVLADDASLRDVKARLEKAAAAIGELPGGKAVTAELAFWTRWLDPFLPLEGAARMQARERRNLAAQGLEVIRPLWPKAVERLVAKLPEGVKLEPGTLDSPTGTLRTLEAMVKKMRSGAELEDRVKVEAAVKQVKPTALALEALWTLSATASPAAVLQLEGALAQLGHQHGDAVVKQLRDVVKRLDALRERGDVEVGRKERSGPMAVLSVRAAQQLGAAEKKRD